jgi:glycosyltransferase involved in cell wall biosynthesis
MSINKVRFFKSELFRKGSPADSRLKAYKNYFHEKNHHVLDEKLMLSIFFKNQDCHFIVSMPPFRNFWFFFIPGVKIILDIRDGWSIAQKSGYGGNVKRKPFKSKMSRVIERFIIQRSYLSITCTPGLQEYLSKVSDRKLLLIPNGVNDEDLELIDSLKDLKIELKDSRQLVFCCAGQFSEYGKDKVRVLLQVIADRYQGKKLIIQLIGSNQKANSWVAEHFNMLTSGNGKVEILPRMGKKELFSTMLKADYGLTILRDPSYEWGTKIYDYIALGLPVVNYFDRPNGFTDYFDACLDVSFNNNVKAPEIRRSVLIKSALDGTFHEVIV